MNRRKIPAAGDAPAAALRNVQFVTSIAGAAFLDRLIVELGERAWEVGSLHLPEAVGYRGSRGWRGRLNLRWQMYFKFSLNSWREARRRPARVPVRVVTTNPFYNPAIVRLGAGGRAVTINWVFDIFPEAFIQAGYLSRNSYFTRIAASPTRYAFRNCDATVFVGEHLRTFAEAEYGAARRSAVIPIGADGQPFRDHPPRPVAVGQKTTLLYAGAMGRMHDTGTLAEALRAKVPESLCFVFHASGKRYGGLRAMLEASMTGDRLFAGAPLSRTAWVEVMSGAHVALVTEARGAERVVMPSKTYSALVAGQAILGICSARSDLADLINRHECGWVVEPGDIAHLARVFAEIANDPQALHAKRCRAFSAGHNEYDIGVIAQRWSILIQDLSNYKATPSCAGSRRC